MPVYYFMSFGNTGNSKSNLMTVRLGLGPYLT